MTSIILYGMKLAATDLSTAGTLTSTGGGTTGTNANTNVGTSLNWGELYGLGNVVAAWPATASEMTTPDGIGWLWDVTTLEGQRIASATLTFKMKMEALTAGFTATAHARLFKWNVTSHIYTALLSSDAVFPSTAFATGSFSNITATATINQTDFATGDKLYMDMPANITVAASSAATWVNASGDNGAIKGIAGNIEIDGITYTPTPTASHLFFCDGLGGVFS